MTLVARLHDAHVYWRRHLPRIRSREAPRAGTENRTGSSEGHCAHRAIVAPQRSRKQSNAQNEGFDGFRRNGGTVTRWSVNATTAIVKARARHNDGNSSSYLVVRPRDTDRTPLGQDGIARPLRHARIRCEGSCGVLRQAPSEKEALGFAVRELRWGHALRELSGAPTANSSREPIPPQLHWSGIDKIRACISF